MKRKASAKTTIRIIAGRWRGSRIAVLDKQGLRPTPDRIRETLFNWLAMDVPGARVLDCFAGAGGLGFEAASREAQSVLMVDQDREVVQQLKQQASHLRADNIKLYQGDILGFLPSLPPCFDIVFIDPPYAEPDLRTSTLETLIERGLLCQGAKIYLEWPKDQQMPLIQQNLTWVRQKTAGQVNYGIAQWGLTG